MKTISLFLLAAFGTVAAEKVSFRRLVEDHGDLIRRILRAFTTEKAIRRLTDSTIDSIVPGVSSGEVDGQDITCAETMAKSESDCTSNYDLNFNPCVWCPLGDLGGLCLTPSEAEEVNGVAVPNVECGKAPSEENVDFWNVAAGCVLNGWTGKGCLGTPGGCSYCTVAEPASFGICYSDAFVDEVTELAGGEDNMEGIMCTNETDSSTLSVGSIMDLKCIISGNADDFVDVESLCSEILDTAGNPCVTVSVMGFLDVCVTQTQANMYNAAMEALDEAGIDVDSVAGTAMSAGTPSYSDSSSGM